MAGGGVWESNPPFNGMIELGLTQNTSHDLSHDCFRIQRSMRTCSVHTFFLI
jgi:hypothetical protein